MSRWRIRYESNAGEDDAVFWQSWTVTDGFRSFKVESDKESAEWLCELLNRVADYEYL